MGLIDGALGFPGQMTDKLEKILETKFGKKLEAATEATVDLTRAVKELTAELRANGRSR